MNELFRRPRPLERFRRLLPIFALSALTSFAGAQNPEVTSLSPAGGPRGAEAAIKFVGKDLQGAILLVSGKGIMVRSVTPAAGAESVEAVLSIAASASLGLREIRVVTPRGISSPLPFWVDVYPNREEREPNDSASNAQALGSAPVVLDGIIGSAGDTDAFSFDAKEGDVFVAEVNAARIHSRIDPVLEMTSESGGSPALAKPTQGGDSRIVYRCEKPGRHIVVIRDRNGGGGIGFVYRLTVGRLPAVTEVLPHGEKPGRKVSVQLQGANLGKTTSAVVTIPEDAGGIYWTAVRTAAGVSLPFPLLVDFAPVVGLTETDALMPLPTLPCALEGVFSVYPSLRFAFEAAPAGTLIFEMFGQSLGSEVEGAIRVSDMSGMELATSGRGGSEARIEFTAPSEGVYVLQVRDISGKLGPDHGYRLSARRATPDFRVFLNGDRLVVPASSSLKVPLSVERASGFNGPITIAASGLPRGMRLTGGTLPAGHDTAELTFTTENDSPRAPALVTLTASALVNGKRVSHRVVPRTQWPGESTPSQVQSLPLVIVGRLP